MASQFILSPQPPCSHVDQPGIIVPPSATSTFSGPNQNPVPSSSPCQECAIHNTIIQSMAFNMQGMDHGICPHSNSNQSCFNGYDKYQFHSDEQHSSTPFDQSFYMHPIYRTQCGHNPTKDCSYYSNYIQQNTQVPIQTNGPPQISVYQGWSRTESTVPDQSFPHERDLDGIITVPKPFSADSVLGNHVPSTTLTPPVSFIPSSQTEQSFDTLSAVDAVANSISNMHQYETPNTTQSRPFDQLKGLSSMKISDMDVKPDLTAGTKTVNRKRNQKSHGVDGRKKSGPDSKKSEVRKRQPEDLCAVCGDKASGYHYNALTCEGCKGFFRRSITNKTNYKQGCKQGGNCEMDTYTRRKCPHCRFKKCKEVGMLEECLLTEIQCRSKRIRRQQKKQQQQQQQNQQQQHDELPRQTNETRMYEASPNNNVTSPEPSSIASSPSGSEESQNGDLTVSLSLTEEESKLIQAVSEAFKKYNINPDIVRRWEKYINKESKTTCRLSDITTVHVQVLVDYAKNIPGFSALEPEDQIALLKGSVFEAMLLRNSCGYHHLRRDINKSAILDELGIAAKKFEALLDFFNAIGKLGMDEVEYGLLIAIVIFNSDYAFVQNKDRVEEYQDLYLSALAKYSLTREPVRPSIFARILGMLTEIRSVSYNNAEIVASWKKRGALTPLLCEIWDLD